MRARTISLSLLIPALLVTSTVVAGASTSRPTFAPQRLAAPDTTGAKPTWATIASPLAGADVTAGTYGSMTG